MTFRLKALALIFFGALIVAPLSATAQNDSDPFMDAQILISGGRYLEAVAQYQSLVDSSEHDATKASALFFIALVYDNYLDQPERALTCYTDIIRLYPESQAAADALFNSGSILYKNDRYAEARKAFQDYVERYPDGMRCQSAMAWADSAAKHIPVLPARPAGHPVLTVLSPNLRILLVKNKKTLTVSSVSSLNVRDITNNRILYNGDGPVIVSLKKGQLALNSRLTDGRGCIISSHDFLNIDGQRYRGQIQLLVKPSGLMVVNTLSVEDYLYGVVPKEMSWLWHPEALKAQAIASRTYALYIRDKQRLAGSDYDLEATTASQVYGGLEAEKEQGLIAVDQTRGMVITFKGKLIIAYFHANSGGYTESALNVWGVDIPYLKSVADNFSTIQPDNIWEYRVTYNDLNHLFKQKVPNLGPIRRVEAGRKSQSGRILSFKLVSANTQTTLSGNVFRMTLGPTELRSTLFDIYPNQQGILFRGSGYGHGVGLSQWGAHRMAQAGYSSEAIIKHYYKGVAIMTVSYL